MKTLIKVFQGTGAVKLFMTQHTFLEAIIVKETYQSACGLILAQTG